MNIEKLKSWTGSTIEEIMEGITSERQAPKVEASENHTVLFEFPRNRDEMPIPIEKADEWNDLYVKLPCNSQSTYREINDDGDVVMKSRWELIKSSLKDERIKNSRDLERVIKIYNNKYEKSWDFSTLHELFEDEFTEEDTNLVFEEIIPKLIDHALDLPNLIKAPIPLLKKGMNHSISMSQQQVSCLLANAFFCTFPKRASRNSDFPEINFNRLYSSQGQAVINKIKCILRYFQKVLMTPHTDVLTFQRRYIEPKSFPDWKHLDLKFSSIKWHVSCNGTIEEGDRMLQVDFANRYLGGGVIGGGCVQEEIRFVVNPECLVGMLFCESMRKEEAFYIYGSKQFNNYQGYGGSFEWAGDCKNKTYEYDDFRRKLVHIVAIDALSFSYKSTQQFEEFLIRRELNKAYCGFYSEEDDESPIPVATGNWGCGAFRGYNRLKCLIQLMACVASRRNLVYYTFNDFELLLEMEEMFQFLQNNEITVSQLWRYLTNFEGKRTSFALLYHHIHEQFQAEKLLEGLEDLSDFNTSTQDIAEKKSSEPHLISEEISNTNEDVLENPTKKMKINDSACDDTIKVNLEKTADDLSLEKEENETKNALLEQKITDYFTKN